MQVDAPRLPLLVFHGEVVNLSPPSDRPGRAFQPRQRAPLGALAQAQSPSSCTGAAGEQLAAGRSASWQQVQWRGQEDLWKETGIEQKEARHRPPEYTRILPTHLHKPLRTQ
eukprot:768531-Hanusia_phi.AAC.5